MRAPWPAIGLLFMPAFASLAQDVQLGSLDEVVQALTVTPPAVGNHGERFPILQALDRLLEQPDTERSPTVGRYYRSMVDRVIEEVAATRVIEAVVVWKLYSSSTIIKTSRSVFAIDLDEGPKGERGEWNRDPAAGGITVCMTDRQRARLAELIDVSFHTHRHHDHIDYALTTALTDAGKTVVVPDDIRRMWQPEPFAAKLKTIDGTPTTTETLGALTVEVLSSRQWMASDHSISTPCNAYLITTHDGVTILAKGDINDGTDILPWLTTLDERGVGVDLYVGHVFYWWGSDALPRIIRMFDPFIVPGHEFEFTHREPGEAGSGTGSYGSLHKRFETALERGKAAVLSWGERFHYIPRLHRAAKSPLVWIEVDPQPREIRVGAGDTFGLSANISAEGVTVRRCYLSFQGY